MKKIRIGHIGIAHDHAAPVLQCVLRYPEIFEFIGYAEENPANFAKKIVTDPFYNDLPRKSVAELIAEKPDAMLIEGYELDNLDAALLCIENGIHIHFDKPAGADLAKFKKILDLAKEKGLAVHMGYMYRYNNAVQYAMDRVKDGTLGEIYQVDAFMDTCHDPEKRQWMHEFPGGDMFFLGCHMIDFVYMFMGGAPIKVYPFNRRSHIDGTDVVDQGCAVLDYGKAVSTVRASSTQVNGYGRRQLVLCGTKGTIEIKPLELPIPSLGMRQTVSSRLWISTKEMVGDRIYQDVCEEIELPPTDGRYDKMMLEFAKIVRGEMQPVFDYDYEYELQKLVLECCAE